MQDIKTSLTSSYFPRGFDIFPLDFHTDFMGRIELLISQHFDFLPRIFLPCVSYGEVFKNNFLNEFELFTLHHPKHNIVLSPEYTVFFEQLLHLHTFGLIYLQPCFRREKPQSFRQRQFLQMGLETHLPKSNSSEYIHFLLNSAINFITDIFGGDLSTLQISFNCVSLVRAEHIERKKHFDESIKKNLPILSDDEIYSQTRQDFINLFSTLPHSSWDDTLYRGLGYYAGLIVQFYLDGVEIGGGGMYGDNYFGFAFGIYRLYQIFINRMKDRVSINTKYRIYFEKYSELVFQIIKNCRGKILICKNYRDADIIIDSRENIKFRFQTHTLQEIISIINHTMMH